MLAQRFIAICDGKCNAKTRCTVLLEAAQAVRGVLEPITLRPTKIVFDEKGWSFGWNQDRGVTEIHCPKHGGKKNAKRNRDSGS